MHSTAWGQMQGTHEIQLGTITDLGDSLVMIKAHDGIEVTESMVLELFDLLKQLANGPLGLLINRENSYSLSYPAMLLIHRIKEIIPDIEGIAIVVYNRCARVAAEIQAGDNHDMQVFDSMWQALVWLEERILPMTNLKKSLR
jgi:hypothetical protein